MVMCNLKKLNTRLVPLTIGVSGHIDILEDDVISAKEQFLSLIEEFYHKFPHTPIQLLVSLAVGSDRIAAKAFIEFREKIKNEQPETCRLWELIAVLPMSIDEFKKDFSNSVEEFNELLKVSDFCVTMPLQKNTTLLEISTPGEARNRQYQDATRYISSHSNILVVFWDGNDPGKIGGTHDAIRMRLFTHSLDDQFHYSLLAADQAQFVHHIKIRRKSSLTNSKNEARFEISPSFSNSIEKTIKNFKDIIKIDRFNKRILTKINFEQFNDSLEYLFSSNTMENVKSNIENYSLKSLLELYATFDALSIKCEKEWRIYTKIIYIAGFITAFLLPVAIEDIFLPWSMIGYLILLLFAFGFYTLIRLNKLEDYHVESRALAEFIRVQIVWLYNGYNKTNNINRIQTIEFNHHFPEKISTTFLGQQLISLDWVGRVLTSLIIVPNISNSKESKIIDDKIILDWIIGQKLYFEKSQSRIEKTLSKIDICSKLLIFGGLISALVAIVMVYFDIHEDRVHQIFVVLAASLPIMSVVLENFSDTMGYEMLEKNNDRLLSIFKYAFFC